MLKLVHEAGQESLFGFFLLILEGRNIRLASIGNGLPNLLRTVVTEGSVAIGDT